MLSAAVAWTRSARSLRSIRVNRGWRFGEVIGSEVEQLLQRRKLALQESRMVISFRCRFPCAARDDLFQSVGSSSVLA